MTQPAIFDSTTLESALSSLMDGHCEHLVRDTEGRLTSLLASPQEIRRLDGPGLIEYLFYRITRPHVVLPSGSSRQEAWFRARYRRVPYLDAARVDSILRIAFHDRRPRTPVRPVWFIVNGYTIESTMTGRTAGPSSLRWDERRSGVSDCFQLGLLLPMRWDAAWIPGLATGTTARRS